MRLGALAVAVTLMFSGAALAAPAAAVAVDPVTEARVAAIARANAALVEVHSADEPAPKPVTSILPLNKRDCAARDGEVMSDRLCRVTIKPFPFGEPATREGQKGSGFVIDAEAGLILTANHILGSSDDPKVKLADGRTVDAKIIGRDGPSGLALLHIAERGLTALPLATRAPRQGDASVLVGRLLPLDTSIASTGIFGGRLPHGADDLKMPWAAELWLVDNLLAGGGIGGGPILNAAGEVGGMATAILSKDGYGQSAGTIMVALHNVAPVIDALKASGRVERSVVGIGVDCRKTKCTAAVVHAGFGADNGGMQAGDQLVRVDGQSIDGMVKLMTIIAAKPIGSAVLIDVVRDGTPMTLTIITDSSTRIPDPETASFGDPDS